MSEGFAIACKVHELRKLIAHNEAWQMWVWTNDLRDTPSPEPIFPFGQGLSEVQPVLDPRQGPTGYSATED